MNNFVDKPCILPWINFGTNTFGRARVCGYSETKSDIKLKDSTILDEWNNEYFKEIRRKFINNEWPENCKRCKYVESLNGLSKRIEENSYFYEDFKHLIENTNVDGSLNSDPKFIDVRTGTICNLKCIHCGTGASSKWKEDKSVLNKYENTQDYYIDNKWIEVDTKFWDHLKSIAHTTIKYNFLGGESFANKRHNEFITYLSETEYCKNIKLQYVSNGLLITEQLLEKLKKFNFVTIMVSVDALGLPGEFFRFPLKWKKFMSQLEMMNNYSAENIKIGVQWTCSNVSMFYLTDTYKEIVDKFPHIEFAFSNHVTWPIHMSAQNLPAKLKEKIIEKIKNFEFRKQDVSLVQFYINHMMENDLWNDYGKVFMSYINDLSNARKINWKENLKEMDLEKYE